jgi:hypothetical protein
MREQSPIRIFKLCLIFLIANRAPDALREEVAVQVGENGSRRCKMTYEANRLSDETNGNLITAKEAKHPDDAI